MVMIFKMWYADSPNLKIKGLFTTDIDDPTIMLWQVHIITDLDELPFDRFCKTLHVFDTIADKMGKQLLVNDDILTTARLSKITRPFVSCAA